MKVHLPIEISMDSHNIISFLLMIGHHKFILLIVIKELMLWFQKKNVTSHHFFRIIVRLTIRLNMVHAKISFLFITGFYKHILFIGINGIDGFIRNSSLSTILRTITRSLIWANTDSHNYLLSFQDWAL